MEDLEARAWFANRIEEAGLFVHDDDAGNLSGILHAADPDARTLIVGSHLDTVLNAGRFDGAVGILAGLEVLRTVQDAGLNLPLHLEVLDFTDDEGTWHPMFGSRCLTGQIKPDYLREANGHASAFRAALIRAGINPEHVARARRDPATVAGYIELHVEQGGRLEQMDLDIGVVTGIVGRSAYKMTFRGQAGHAGTASMYGRRDALQAAARFVSWAHEMVIEEFSEGMLNCSNLEVEPGMLTIIPSEARVTLECRHVDEHNLADLESALVALADDCAAACGLTVDCKRINRIEAAAMAHQITAAIEESCQHLQVAHVRLPSYASHNGQVMSAFTPSGMFFIPSVGGLSHNPAEYSHWEDVVTGTNVLLHAVLNLAQ
jgi:N-carbamoyl-L-amino-acid hydrolase